MPNFMVAKAKGLHTFTNYLSEVPEGALLKADNVVIDRDGIIESRRGFAIYGNSFGGDDDRAKQVHAYKGRILRHYATTFQFDSDGAGTFVSFNEPVEEVAEGLRIKGIETNGNFLFTTSEGIKKISVVSAEDLAADNITNAGVPKAITIRGAADTGTPGFLSTSSKVAYRLLWGYKDANSNLLLGAPSTRIVVENTDPGNTAVVDLEVLIPEGITTAYFYQLYRSAIVPNTSEPDDELNLVLEANPTSAEIAAGSLFVTDVTPDDFRVGGVLLYTNPISGEGINQANEAPPLAKDIALFKNHTFYANTTTRHKLFLNLLSVDDFTNGISDLIISDGADTETYIFDATENAAIQQVLLSTDPSVAIAVDETARSLEYVINKQANGIVYAYYISGPNDVPGALLLERRDQSDNPFYLATSDSNIVDEWNPSLPLVQDISAITTGSTPTVSTTGAHGYSTGDVVVIYDTDSTPVIDGKHEIAVTGASDFTIEVSPPVTIAGTSGSVFLTQVASDNERAPNRLYISKLQQPEAVPTVNYLDIGPKDQPILRILALRDSLFVLKSDGVYRVTGDLVANFSAFLFDGSTSLFAPDSAVVLNNQIYGFFSDAGVATVSDTGVAVISRPIESDILRLVATQYTDSSTASFGVSYESDRSYLLWTVTNTNDEQATQCWRWNTFTSTWTRWPIEKTCGVVNAFGDDKLYLGAGDTNNIEKERKDFQRYDYADRQVLVTIPTGSITNTTMDIGSTVGLDIGDVVLQTQYLTIAQFNRLLQKLDLDPELSGGFVSNFTMVPGDNITTKLTLLVAELNVQDPSTVYVFSGTTDPATIQEEYNVIINQLNMSPGVFFVNYAESTGTVIYDSIILFVDRMRIQVLLNYPTPFIAGDAFIYKAIYNTVDWAPVTLGDPSMTKHVREATMLFQNQGFYGATVAYSSDLSRSFEEIPFVGSGNGQFGSFVFGQHTFGGEGNQIPVRTYIPQQKQRCRWINARFQHKYALENPAIYGISFTFEPTSSRGYK